MKINTDVKIKSRFKKRVCHKGHDAYDVSIRLPVNQSARRLPYIFCPKCEVFIKVKPNRLESHGRKDHRQNIAQTTVSNK